VAHHQDALGATDQGSRDEALFEVLLPAPGDRKGHHVRHRGRGERCEFVGRLDLPAANAVLGTGVELK